MRSPLDDSISYSHFVSVVAVSYGRISTSVSALWSGHSFMIILWTFSHLFALSLFLSLSPVISLPVTVVSFHTLSPVRLDCLRTMSSAYNLFWSLIVGADGVIHFIDLVLRPNGR